MRTVGIEKRIDMPLVALFVTCILFLWGVEPVIVYEAYRQEHLLPADVLLLRSLIIAIPLLLWSLLNIQKVKPKPLPLLNKLIIAGSLGIFMMLYFRYNLLLDTIPSNYMVMYRNHAFLVILYFLPFALFKTKPFLTAVFLACLIVGNLLLLLLTPQWPWEYKIFNILAFIGLAIYSITSQIFAENYHVKIRYFRFIGIIYLYSSFFAAINYFSTVENPFARIVSLLDNHIFLLGFLSIAAVAPHYLVYHLNLKYRNSLYTQIPTALTWIVTIGMEMWILKLPFNYIAFVSGILITAGIIILLWIKRSKERLDVPF